MTELPTFFWVLYYVGMVGCVAIVFLHFFGDRIEAASKRLEAEEGDRAERNRAWLADQERQAAERDRLRELANAELERLWALKQKS